MICSGSDQSEIPKPFTGKHTGNNLSTAGLHPPAPLSKHHNTVFLKKKKKKKKKNDRPTNH
jgi:hypothetical protein